MLPIPFQKRERKQSISERLEGRKKFETLLKSAPKSLGAIIRLHEAYESMTESPLFKVIEEEIQALELDVRTQSNFAVLLYSTGKVQYNRVAAAISYYNYKNKLSIKYSQQLTWFIFLVPVDLNFS